MIWVWFFVYAVLLMASFYLLARVSDNYFVDSLERISEKWKISSDAAGATLMAMGSSAPELFVAIMSLVKPGDHADVGMGTIVGSALFNVLVIIGVSSVIRKSILTWQPVVRDTAFYLLSIILLLVFFLDAKIVLYEALILVAVYVFYVVAVVYWKKIFNYKEEEPDDVVEIAKNAKIGWKQILVPFDYSLDKVFPRAEKYYAVFGVSILLIGALSWVLVESAVKISEILNIPAAIVALTVLAAGTSVPDLMSSVIVARKGRGGMAISNALGSNVFDILIGLGVPWLLLLFFGGASISVSTENLLSSIILLFATVVVIFFLLLVRKWKIGKRSGYFLIVLYIFYLIWAIYQVV